MVCCATSFSKGNVGGGKNHQNSCSEHNDLKRTPQNVTFLSIQWFNKATTLLVPYKGDVAMQPPFCNFLRHLYLTKTVKIERTQRHTHASARTHTITHTHTHILTHMRTHKHIHTCRCKNVDTHRIPRATSVMNVTKSTIVSDETDRWSRKSFSEPESMFGEQAKIKRTDFSSSRTCSKETGVRGRASGLAQRIESKRGPN
jgi:23S rRNA maturation mini-RNase III